MMAIAFTRAARERIAARQQEHHARLVAQARDMQLVTDPDYCTPASCLIWEPRPGGRVVLASVAVCTCREFALAGNCVHRALLRDITGTDENATVELGG